jgi:hypothetical protein
MVELRPHRLAVSRRRTRSAIPSVDARALASGAHRTRLALAALALAVLAVAALLVPAAGEKPPAPAALQGGKGLMIVIDVSSSTLGFSKTIASSLQTLSTDPSRRAGLVLASQSAYMALPPETPASALAGWARMIRLIDAQNHKLAVRARLDRTPLPDPAPGDYPWVGVFTGGTRLSTGFGRALRGLREAGVRDGQIVLVSDLADAPDDLARVGAVLTRMREEGTTLRVVTVGQATRDPKAFAELGGSAFIMSAADAVFAPDRAVTVHEVPSTRRLVILGIVLALLLAAIEPLLPLRWRADAEARR